MLSANVTLDKDFRIGTIDRRVFGSFVEHLGRAIYGGLYEPGHPTADANGFRGDVLDLVRELAVPLIRYPGGNFVSSYIWEDGVGPVEDRPTRLDLAWRTTEPNLIGTNDFAGWAKLANAEVMMAVNLGTRGIEAASALLEYCNHPGGSYWSDLRKSHGVTDPHGFKLWCLGNEMDGPWQVGQMTATDYGRKATETAKAMKLLDSTIELVACGSSNAQMPTYPDWEATVLDHTFEHVDYISLHQYLRLDGDDIGTFLAESIALERYIETIVSVCDVVAARKRSRKQIMISFDEWNVWYHSRPKDRDIMSGTPWTVAPPLVEDTYTMIDALAFGCSLIALLKHVDRVKVACLAQLVNVIAPIMTETGGTAWRQTIFYPFMHASLYGRGDVLDLRVTCPTYATERIGDVPYIEATATIDDELKAVTIFAVNRSQTDEMDVEFDLRSLPPLAAFEWIVLDHPNPEATNTANAPDRVTPRQGSGASIAGGQLRVTLTPFSWNVIRLDQR